ncbi:MAG: indole-3-glycerol phosphate synthase TrpC [bacterium]
MLTQIAANKRLEVEQLKIRWPQQRLLAELTAAKALPRGRFRQALEGGDDVKIIAELKKGSPSKGVLVPDFDPADLAAKYKIGGAAALSILTDRKYFYGCFENLLIAAEAADLPRLCKDFLIDPYQLYYARKWGADAALLIVRLHSMTSLNDHLAIAIELGMDCLVEVHDQAELEVALQAGATIIGVNNRNLDTFETDLATAEELANRIPEGVLRVAESGIFSRSDVERLAACGYNCFLIGEALVTAADPVALLQELRGA